MRFLGWMLILFSMPIAQLLQFIGVSIFGADLLISTVSYGTVMMTGATFAFWRQ
jgi:hypothetical protein